MSIEKARYFYQEKQFPPILKRVASIHGVNLSEKEIENIGVIATTCGIADDIVDQCQSPADRRVIFAKALLYLEGKQDFLPGTGFVIHPAYVESMKYLKEFVNSLEPQRKETFISCLRIWNKLSEKRRLEMDLNQSLKLRKADLGYTARIYLAGISDENRREPGYNNLAKDIRQMVRIAGMLDDASDLPRDYEDQVVSIKPSIKNRICFLGNGIIMGSKVLRYVFETQLIKDTVKIMAREFKRRGKHNVDQYKICGLDYKIG